jgi:hypothetical protein
MEEFVKRFKELRSDKILVDEELVYKPADELYGEKHAIGSRKSSAYINPEEKKLNDIFNNIHTLISDLNDKKKFQSFGFDIIDHCKKCQGQYLRKEIYEKHFCNVSYPVDPGVVH